MSIPTGAITVVEHVEVQFVDDDEPPVTAIDIEAVDGETYAVFR